MSDKSGVEGRAWGGNMKEGSSGPTTGAGGKSEGRGQVNRPARQSSYLSSPYHYASFLVSRPPTHGLNGATWVSSAVSCAHLVSRGPLQGAGWGWRGLFPPRPRRACHSGGSGIVSRRGGVIAAAINGSRVPRPSRQTNYYCHRDH